MKGIVEIRPFQEHIDRHTLLNHRFIEKLLKWPVKKKHFLMAKKYFFIDITITLVILSE